MTSTSHAIRRKGIAATARAYVMLTKPRIIELLLITTVPPMVVAQRLTAGGGFPDGIAVVVTLVGGTLAAGAANALNCVIDRDVDAKMARTNGRPIPANEVSAAGAIVFAVILQAVSIAVLQSVNWLSAVLALAGTIYYVLVYTVALKRITVQNIVVGGAAGAVPVLVGWAAVTGSVTSPEDLPAWVMFMLVFYWTPPHFWSLAIKYRDDYAAADVPMMPVVRGLGETARQILRYSGAMVGISLLLGAVGRMGFAYFVPTLVLGAMFVKLAVDLVRDDESAAKAMRLFHFSISYLALVFVLMGVDALVLGPA